MVRCILPIVIDYSPVGAAVDMAVQAGQADLNRYKNDFALKVAQMHTMQNYRSGMLDVNRQRTDIMGQRTDQQGQYNQGRLDQGQGRLDQGQQKIDETAQYHADTAAYNQRKTAQQDEIIGLTRQRDTDKSGQAAATLQAKYDQMDADEMLQDQRIRAQAARDATKLTAEDRKRLQQVQANGEANKALLQGTQGIDPNEMPKLAKMAEHVKPEIFAAHLRTIASTSAPRTQALLNQMQVEYGAVKEMAAYAASEKQAGRDQAVNWAHANQQLFTDHGVTFDPANAAQSLFVLGAAIQNEYRKLAGGKGGGTTPPPTAPPAEAPATTPQVPSSAQPQNPAANAPQKLTNTATAKMYVDRAGGDVKKARELAKADGWDL